MNKEYVDVSNAIADLTSKLTIAQNNLPGYHNKVDEAVFNVQNSAIKSSEQASRAIDGNVGDANNYFSLLKNYLLNLKAFGSISGGVYLSGGAIIIIILLLNLLL